MPERISSGFLLAFRPERKGGDFMGVRIRQKTKGRGQPWWVFINHNGSRKSIKVGSKEAAKETAKIFERELSLGKINLEPSKEISTFKDSSEKWIDGYIKAMRRESTFEKYDQLLKSYILPVFGNITLDKINRGSIRDFLVSKIDEGYSRSTICALRDVLSGVFNYAVDEEMVKANPVSGITKRLELNRKGKEIVEPLTSEELVLYLDTAKEHFKDYYAFFFMASRTGMRLGELLAIRWGGIDFNGSFLWVKQSYRRGRFTAPKNGKTRRVDMSDQLRMTLKDHLTREKKKALKSGLGEVPELVFHRNGRVIEQNYIRRVHNRILSKAGLRHIKLHGLRHTFASLLLSTGESPVYVKEQLGHSSIQITVDIYGQWIPTKKEMGVNRLDTDAPTCTLYAPNLEKSNLSA